MHQQQLVNLAGKGIALSGTVVSTAAHELASNSAGEADTAANSGEGVTHTIPALPARRRLGGSSRSSTCSFISIRSRMLYDESFPHRNPAPWRPS